MKKPSLILIAIAIIFLAASCSTVKFDNSLLQPSNQSLDSLLPNLEISNNSNETGIIDSSRSITTNSYMYTIWQREVENNICDSYTRKMGRIEMTIADTRINTDRSYAGLRMVTAATGGTIIGLGATFALMDIFVGDNHGKFIPLEVGSIAGGAALAVVPYLFPTKIGVSMDVEVRIYANNGQQVWRKQFFMDDVDTYRMKDEEFKAMNYVSDLESQRNAKTNLLLKSFKELITDIKYSLEKDRDLIVSRLEENDI